MRDAAQRQGEGFSPSSLALSFTQLPCFQFQLNWFSLWLRLKFPLNIYVLHVVSHVCGKLFNLECIVRLFTLRFPCARPCGPFLAFWPFLFLIETLPKSQKQLKQISRHARFLIFVIFFFGACFFIQRFVLYS